MLEIAFFQRAKNTTIHSAALALILLEYKRLSNKLKNKRAFVTAARSPASRRHPIFVKLKLVSNILRLRRRFLRARLGDKTSYLYRFRRLKTALRILAFRAHRLKSEKPKGGYYAQQRHLKKVAAAEKRRDRVLSALKKLNPKWDQSKKLKGYLSRLALFRHLVNKSIRRGNKKRALNLIVDELCKLRRLLRARRTSTFALGAILKKVNPFFVLKKHAIGRRVFIIPFPIVKRKKFAVISRLFLRALSRRTERSFRARLYSELKDLVLKGQPPASIKLKKEILRTAFDNKHNTRFLRRFRK